MAERGVPPHQGDAVLIRYSQVISIALFALLFTTEHGYSKFFCNGPLKSSQVEGFETLFEPDFSPSLSHTGGSVAPENMAKMLSAVELVKLEVKSPIVAAEVKLNVANARTLKGWLNDNAAESVPGWFSTTLGIVAPNAWIGLAADVAVQLVNGAGDAGRIKLANIAGTVSEGGFVGVVHRVVNSAGGKRSYIWNYMYTAELNGKKIVFLLGGCEADVVIK